jgi:hypothetical protein
LISPETARELLKQIHKIEFAQKYKVADNMGKAL